MAGHSKEPGNDAADLLAKAGAQKIPTVRTKRDFSAFGDPEEEPALEKQHRLK